MSYSYAIAKEVLSDGEKDRILAIFLSSDENNDVNWDKATQAFGAASVESMKVSYRNLLKKIEKAGGKTGVAAPSANSDSATPSAPKTPRTPKTPKGKGGRPPKRKAEAAGSDDDEDGDAPKTLRKKAAKNAAKAEDEDEDEDAPRSILRKATKKTVSRTDDGDSDDGETSKAPKKAVRPRKTPVKPTKAAVGQIVDGREEADNNTDSVSGNTESLQEDGEASEMVKDEDESEF
ncbi:hypothetical protein E4T47_00993 [Aureobasidium subglaciale]|nr:hypothetical protein E4T47_00993 [Aureobasidium subglaciale]